MEKFDIKGYWWVPKRPAQKLAGDLSYSPDEGAYLSLLGVLGKPFTNNPEKPEIILGTSQEGKSFTLFNLIPTNINWAITGLGGSKYFAHFVFEGAHFKSKNAIKFHKLQGRYTDLDAWANMFGFKIDDGFSHRRSSRKPSIKYSLPKSKLFELPDETKVGITFWSKGPAWNIVQTEAKITQETFFIARSPKGDVSFFDLNKYLSHLADLLQVASQRIAIPEEIIGFTEANAEQYGEKKEKYHPPVRIFYQPIEKTKSPKRKTQHDMLFSFKDLTKTHITKWFSAYEKHQTQIYLHRSLIYNERTFAETRFLNIVQALEALHGTLFKSNLLDAKIFAIRREAVVSSAPPRLRKWLRSTIGENNFKRLKQRIFELLKRKHSLFKNVILDDNKFAYRVRATRNQFIHQARHKAAFVNGKELHCATLLLRLLFESYMLQVIGFSSKRVAKIYIRRINEYKSWGTIFN